jgi:Domain of unknown function (DUF4389)
VTEPVPATTHHTPVGRIVMIVIGGLLVIIGGLAGLGGAALTWAHATQRDAEGFFTTPTERLDTTARAITSDDIDLGAGPGERFDLGDLATVRIEVDSATETPVFVGIGPEQEVSSYLDGVARAEIEDLDFDPFKVEYRFTEGEGEPAPPAEQTFWAAVGSDDESLLWDLEEGNWVVVVMNADGSAGVSVDASVAAKADWVLPLGLGLLIGGFVVVAGGALLVVFGIIGLRAHPAAPVAGDERRGQPIRLTGRLDPPINRALWLVKWLLLIPHVVVLAVLWVAVAAVSVIAWFAIVFTGRYPRAMFDFTVGVLRWTWRVSYYSYGALGTDRYPPFSLQPDVDYPATYDVDYPERLSRGLVWVKSWLLAIPHLVVVGIFAGGWGFSRWSDGRGAGAPSLIGLFVLIAAVSLLFTTRYPRGLFGLVIGLNRWVFRVLAYVLLLRDEYPPFRLDQGEDEPPAASD